MNVNTVGSSLLAQDPASARSRAAAVSPDSFGGRETNSFLSRFARITSLLVAVDGLRQANTWSSDASTANPAHSSAAADHARTAGTQIIEA
jgi:hypothetical protein